MTRRRPYQLWLITRFGRHDSFHFHANYGTESAARAAAVALIRTDPLITNVEVTRRVGRFTIIGHYHRPGYESATIYPDSIPVTETTP